ncbi:MAG: hypothetical protein AVDCRST_MAG37-2797, partial [uncultured Rubrobacteraceae bacterium]
TCRSSGWRRLPSTSRPSVAARRRGDVSCGAKTSLRYPRRN